MLVEILGDAVGDIIGEAVGDGCQLRLQLLHEDLTELGRLAIEDQLAPLP